MALVILHGIGMVLLWILRILLILLIYFLVCPIWIRLRGEFKPEILVKLRVFGFIHFWQISYDSSGDNKGLQVAACWGKVVLYPKKPKQPKEKERPPEEKEAGITAAEQATEEEPSGEVSSEEVNRTKEQRVGEDPSVTETSGEEETATGSDGTDTKGSEAAGTSKDKKQKKTPLGKKGSKPKKPPMSDEEKQARREKMQAIYKLLTDEQNHQAVSFILRQLKGLLGTMNFNLNGTDFAYALSEPAYTGYLSGVLAILPFMYGDDIRLAPDFTSEESYARGYISLCAHLNPCVLVWVLIRIVANSDCRRFMKQVKALKG